MPRRRRIEPKILAEIRQKSLLGWSGPIIQKHLQTLHANGEIEQPSPALRTIQTIMSEYALPDPSEPWTLKDADPEDAEVILPELAHMALTTQGSRAQFSRAEAEWILKIRQLAPDLHSLDVLDYAHAYVWCEQKGVGAEVLDLTLAFKTWRSHEGAGAFLDVMGEDAALQALDHIPMPHGATRYVIQEMARRRGLVDEEYKPTEALLKRTRRRGKK